MASDKFRRQLRQEAEQWRSQSLITPEQFQQLAEQYEFAKLEGAARDRFIALIIGLGSVLLGLGVITFVAANWQAIPRELKLLLLLALFGGINAAGFYLWRSAGQGRQRLGQGLLLLGALTLGANLALTGQMFHISGSSSDLFVIWGLAVLGMAYGLRLAPLGVLSILLTGIGYWLGQLGGWDGQPGWQVGLVLHYMPLIAGVVFVPLAYWCRSPWLFGLAAIASMSALQGTISNFVNAVASSLNTAGIWLVLLMTLPPALLWSYGGRRADPLKFRPIAQVLAILGIAGLTYGLSFHASWSDSWEGVARATRVREGLVAGLPLLWNPSVFFALGLVMVQWLDLARPRRTGRWGLPQVDGLVLLSLGMIAAMTAWHWLVAPIGAIATFFANVLLALLAIHLMRDGLAKGARSVFWGGLVLVTLQILSRMLEYDTGLLLKSLAFLVCGAGVMAIGLWFECYVRTLRSVSEDLGNE